MTFDRRTLLKLAAGACATHALPAWAAQVPRFLQSVASDYSKDPRAAAIEWFRDAKFGLFMHYGLYSLLGRGEWVQFKDKIPVAEYAKLKDRFTAEKFDADAITDLALEAGCKYVNITTRHHDGFCLFESAVDDFHSVNSPAKRDLVGELIGECQKKGLGIYLYYSHGRDWRHPHAPNNGDWGGNARPKYGKPDPYYALGDEHDLQKYVQYMKDQVTELLTNYGPVGGIWLDGHATPVSRRKKIDQFKMPELYDHIRKLQPHALISYKEGVLGTEDFFAPERNWKGRKGELKDAGREKVIEVCDTLQPHSWGHKKQDDGKHKSADWAYKKLKEVNAARANLLLNTGPLADGSIPAEDVKTLRSVGNRLRAEA